jgi:hypothetical protein
MLRSAYVAVPGPTKEFLESGCALIIASVDDDLVPHASRGWGLDVVGENLIRMLVDADDDQLHANLAANGAIAIGATSVLTLRSVQLKGHTTAFEPGTEADLHRLRRYCDQFFGDIKATDGYEPELMTRIVPARLAAYRAEFDEVFDQTPGPGAGSVFTA